MTCYCCKYRIVHDRFGGVIRVRVYPIGKSRVPEYPCIYLPYPVISPRYHYLPVELRVYPRFLPTLPTVVRIRGRR